MRLAWKLVVLVCMPREQSVVVKGEDTMKHRPHAGMFGVCESTPSQKAGNLVGERGHHHSRVPVMTASKERRLGGDDGVGCVWLHMAKSASRQVV